MSSIGNYVEESYLNEIMKIKEPYMRVKVLVYTLFKDRVNDNGERIIEHLIRVSNRMKTMEGKLLALVHEINDYFNIDLNDLMEFGITKDIIESLELINNTIQLDKIIGNKNYLALELITEDMLDNNSNEVNDTIDKKDEVKKLVFMNKVRKER